MLDLFERYGHLFSSWQVVRYEQEGVAYLLQISAVLTDGSRLELRDYAFADGRRKYAYHWMKADGKLLRRWDNAPHWPDVATAPHHVHIPDQPKPQASTITNMEDLLSYLDQSFRQND